MCYSKKCLRWIVLYVNLILAIGTLIYLIYGVLYKLHFITEYQEKRSTIIRLAPITTFVIVIASVVIVIACLGCLGAIMESTCILTTYAVILIFLFLVQLALALIAFVTLHQYKYENYEDLEKLFNRYNDDVPSMNIINMMQQNLRCCGVEKPDFWNKTSKDLNKVDEFPASCCSNYDHPCSVSNSFPDGCSDKVYWQLKEMKEVIGYTAIGLCAIQFSGIIFAFCLISYINRYYRYG